MGDDRVTLEPRAPVLGLAQGPHRQRVRERDRAAESTSPKTKKKSHPKGAQEKKKKEGWGMVPWGPRFEVDF